jgi:hypothetical protein
MKFLSDIRFELEIRYMKNLEEKRLVQVTQKFTRFDTVARKINNRLFNFLNLLYDSNG